jgi:hypothetical protein
VVHAESLVGEDQFWLTRPYEWKKLFGSKLLFLLIWLYLPFFAAQVLLLAESGFHPFAYLPGLLFNLLLATGILVMPLFAIAAVTANFARMTLTVLGALIVLLGVAFAATLVIHPSASIPSSDRISIPLVLCLCGVAITLQYAARRVWLARGLLLTAPALIAAILFGMSQSENSQINRYYPRRVSALALPFEVQLTPDPIRKVTGDLMQDANQRFIEIPLRVAGVADGLAIEIDDVRATFIAPNGFSWTSPWEAVYDQRYLPDSEGTVLSVGIDRAAYERLQSTPLEVHLSFALTRLRAGRVTNAVLSTSDVEVPGFGNCSAPHDLGFRNFSASLFCRSALHQPQLAHVSVVWSDEPCSGTRPAAEHMAFADGWTGDISPDPAEFGITSVWTPYIYFTNRMAHNGMPDAGSVRWHTCPGSPLTVTQYHLVDRTQTEIEIPNFQLPVAVVPTS